MIKPITIFILILLITCHSGKLAPVETIMEGYFKASIVETGELQAVKSRTIVMPWFGWKYGRLKISRLVEEGTEVDVNDFLFELDNSKIIKDIREKENKLILARVEYKRLKASYENTVLQFTPHVATTIASNLIQKKKKKKSQFESNTRQRICQLQLEKAEIEYKRVVRDGEYKKQRQEYQIKLQKLQIEQLERDIADAKKALDQTYVRSPVKGIVEYKRSYRGRRKIRVGDEYWAGTPLLGIPDLNQMKVITTVNECDISKIFCGQEVLVRLDAFPKIALKGSIINISKLCHPKENSIVNVFDVTVILQENRDFLKPGMTVGCEIIIAEYENAKYVRNDCLYEDNSKYFVRVLEGSEFKDYEVTTGPRNHEFTVIFGRVQAGQTCLVNNGKKFSNAVRREFESII